MRPIRRGRGAGLRPLVKRGKKAQALPRPGVAGGTSTEPEIAAPGCRKKKGRDLSSDINTIAVKELLDRYAMYNTWANETLIHRLHMLDDETLYRSMPSSFKSIAATLEHILRVQKFWDAFIAGKDVRSFEWTPIDGDIRKSMRELKEQSKVMQKHFMEYEELQLKEVLELDMPWALGKSERAWYILHVINHSSFHRGQLITLCRMAGELELPSTDFNIFNLEHLPR